MSIGNQPALEVPFRYDLILMLAREAYRDWAKSPENNLVDAVDDAISFADAIIARLDAEQTTTTPATGAPK